MNPLLSVALLLSNFALRDSELTSKQRKALVHIGHLAISTHLFREFNGDFPRSLRDLVVRPKDAANWPDGGFLGVEAIPKDPWGNDYEYDPRGEEPKIWSWGADGAPGGEGENADLSAKDLSQSAAAEARAEATRATLETASRALERFMLDCARYPEKLEDLVRRPANLEHWKGPYLVSDPKDGWGHDFIYRVPGPQDRPYEILSLGADGREGGEGWSADLSSSPPPEKRAAKKDEPPFQFDPWQAWASFDNGSWVEQETASKFGELPESKSSMRVTITTKTDREVKGIRKMGDSEMADQVLAEKGWKSAGPGGDGSCPMCGKAHKKSGQKWSREEIDVAGKKIRCDVLDQTTFDCKGEKQFVGKTWYCRDVPGWVARSEFEMFGSVNGTVKTVTTSYEKR